MKMSLDNMQFAANGLQKLNTAVVVVAITLPKKSTNRFVPIM